jgi:four helix bundle protein
MTRARARLVTEIVTWQLADQLQIEVFELTHRPTFTADAELHRRTEDAANCVCRNISEGFDCKSDREFAQYRTLSGRSLDELLDSFRVAQLKQYVSASDLTAINALAKHLDAGLRHVVDLTDRGANRSRRAGVRRRASPTSP